MSVFLDTNVLVYCTDPRAPAKQARAREIVAACAERHDGVISTQVLVELFSVLTRKQKVPLAAACTLVQAYSDWPVVGNDFALVHGALEKSAAHGLSIFDALIVEAALRSGATRLFSEDLQDGRQFGPLTLVNPFRDLD